MLQYFISASKAWAQLSEVITLQAYCHMANQNVSRRHSTSIQFNFKYYTSLF